MANTLQAKKRVRQNEKRRQYNASLKSRMRTSMKRLGDVILSKDTELAKQEYRSTCSILDRTASKGIITKNRAARLKSRWNYMLNYYVNRAACNQYT